MCADTLLMLIRHHFVVPALIDTNRMHTTTVSIDIIDSFFFPHRS